MTPTGIQWFSLPGNSGKQLGMLRHSDGVMRMLREELPGGSGLSLFQVLAVLERGLGR